MGEYGDLSYTTTSSSSDIASFFGGGLLIVMLVISLVILISIWKTFKKAGQPGWATLIPIYNTYVLTQIAKLPAYYILLTFIPFVSIYAMFKINIEIAHNFGKSTGFGIILSLFSWIGYPILGFGNATYIDNENIGYKGNMNGMNNNMNSNMNNNMNMNYQNAMNGSVNNMNNNMNSNMNTQPVTPTQTPIQNNVPVEPMVQNANTSFELPKTQPAKQEFIAQEPAAPVVENKFVQPNIEVPNTEPITDVKNNNVQ